MIYQKYQAQIKVWRRLRVIEFSSKFCDNPDPNNENEFKKDPSVSQKIKIWKGAFIAILIEYYKKYLREGLKEPDVVMRYTREYEKENDKYNDFITDHIVKDPKEAIRWQEMFDLYAKWFRRNYTDEKMDRSKDVKKSFETILGEKVKSVRSNENKIIKGWKGYKIRYDLEEEDDEEGHSGKLDL